MYVLDTKSSGELFNELPKYVKNKELFIKENDNGLWLIWSCEEGIWEDYIDEYVYYRRYEGVKLITEEYFSDDELCEYVMPNWCKCVENGHAYGYDDYLISFY